MYQIDVDVALATVHLLFADYLLCCHSGIWVFLRRSTPQHIEDLIRITASGTARKITGTTAHRKMYGA